MKRLWSVFRFTYVFFLSALRASRNAKHQIDFVQIQVIAGPGVVRTVYGVASHEQLHHVLTTTMDHLLGELTPTLHKAIKDAETSISEMTQIPTKPIAEA
jgi:hypothetical protein